jgi:hypothetical protein
MGLGLDKFMENPIIRKAMYEKYGLADRYEGDTVPTRDQKFLAGGYKPLDIDKANFELWKERNQDDIGILGAKEPMPKSVMVQRAFESMRNKNNYTNPIVKFFFGSGK